MSGRRDGRDRGRVDALDYPSSPDARTSLLHAAAGGSRRPSPAASLDDPRGRFFESVAEGIQQKDKERLKREVVRYTSFAWAIISCLCAGSITTYSLYGHLFQSRLHYTQFQVNIVSIVAELALYLPVPIVGLLCDRQGPAIVSLLSAFVFGGGYFLGAEVYRRGPSSTTSGDASDVAAPHGWPFSIMVLAFVGIGVGTSCMYLAAVSTCAKNFGKGKHKGFALATPIASFGLGGMWQSQLGSRVLYERGAQGEKGDVDVFRYFVFLGGLLLIVGLIGSLLLRVVDEGELIDEAVEDLERSGLLESSDFFRPRPQRQASDYGTLNSMDHTGLSESQYLERKQKALEEQRKKTWLLNSETRRFLGDHTMWWLAAGFFLVTGPGEAFINNLGTLIGTLYSDSHSSLPSTSPATHVSIVAVMSTFARIASGTLSDLLAPSAPFHQYPARRESFHSIAESLTSLDPLPTTSTTSLSSKRQLTLSRLWLLLSAAIVLSLGQLLLACGLVQDHASDRFWIISATIGAGYGAVFSLVPIIISCVWGVENFATNWGIVAMAPAGGAAVWGAIYAGVYEWAANRNRDEDSERGEAKCRGIDCYRSTFWGMTAAVWLALLLWLWAWRGKGGWRSRGVAV